MGWRVLRCPGFGCAGGHWAWLVGDVDVSVCESGAAVRSLVPVLYMCSAHRGSVASCLANCTARDQPKKLHMDARTPV